MCINPPFLVRKKRCSQKQKRDHKNVSFFVLAIYTQGLLAEKERKRKYLASRHKKILSLMTTIIAVTSEETEMEALCSLFYILCIFSFEPPQWFVHLTLQRYFAFSWTKKKEKKFDAKKPLSPSAVASPPLALSYICQQFRNTIYEEEEGKVKKKKRMKEKNVKTINRISWKKTE